VALAVKVHTLGRFGLLVDDRPVEHGRKVQQKPLALLKALLALVDARCPRGARRISLAGNRRRPGHNSFEVALSRLRKLMGKEDALVLKEGRLSLSNRQCWVDVWAFERSLGQAEKARKEGKRTEEIRLFEKALSLYRGPLLPSDEMTALYRYGEAAERIPASVTYLGSATRTVSGGGRRSPAME